MQWGQATRSDKVKAVGELAMGGTYLAANTGHTPLHIAAANGRIDKCKVLWRRRRRLAQSRLRQRGMVRERVLQIWPKLWSSRVCS